MRSQMRSMAFGLAVLLAAAVALPATQVRAQGDPCFELWVARNAIFKARGYCFKTSRAISYFGNAGCRYDYEGDVPLTPNDRALVAAYKARSQALGCPF